VRTVIYARYSDPVQNPKSVEDQIREATEVCNRNGWEIVGVFADRAITGVAGIDSQARPGMYQMLERVEAGGVDQVLTESTDRLARHQGDSFEIFERIKFTGARIFSISDGEVTDIIMTFKGLMDAQFRKELGAKVRRGQLGTVEDGRAPGGIAYGYKLANRMKEDGSLLRGLREIDDTQADVVRQIFEMYANDISPFEIAKQLNAQGTPGPRGSRWLPNTITGDRQRKNGLLQNRIYIGKIVHNRTRKLLDPRTRKYLIKPNLESQWAVRA
jgi:DNA invertase Pin-like site-specific DNA recombinase